jgi:uncharacterized membrane protein
MTDQTTQFSPPEPSGARSSTLRKNRSRIFTAPLPDPISKNIETITSLHNREAEGIPSHHRWLEAIASFFGKAEFLYCLLASLLVWITGSWLHHAGTLPLNFPSFSGSNQGLDAAALLISTGVLVRQSRQEDFAEQRTQLMLQLNLLSEQKIAKIIALLEELRADLPEISQRHDPEAQIMQKPADPVEVLDALQDNLKRELSADPLSELIEDKA